MIDYLYKRIGRVLLILDPNTLEEVGRIEAPDTLTVSDVEKFRDHLLKLARESETEPS